MSEGRLELKVQLFAKAKELAGGRDFLLCSLAASDASISCQEFLDRYVYTVSPSLPLSARIHLALPLQHFVPSGPVQISCCNFVSSLFLSAKMKRALSTLVTPWPLCKKNWLLHCACVTRAVRTHVLCCVCMTKMWHVSPFCNDKQAEPKLEVLKGSAFLAVNDEYVEPLDILTLKVRIPSRIDTVIHTPARTVSLHLFSRCRPTGRNYIHSRACLPSCPTSPLLWGRCVRAWKSHQLFVYTHLSA